MTDGAASAETGTPTPDGGRIPTSLAPMGLGLALALFGISSVIVTLSLFVGVPALTRAGLSPFATFTIAFLVPLALMFFVALAAYRLEARPWNWRAFAERMRLGRMRPSGWAWSIALALFMFPLGGTIRWIAAGLLAVVAVWLDGVRGRQAGVLIAAVLAFVGSSWAFAVFGGSTANVVFFVTPKPVTDLFSMIQPTSFMGSRSPGRGG